MNIIKANNSLDKYMDQLLEIEETYDPNLRESAEEKRELYSNKNSILLLLIEGGFVFGERSGLSLTDITEEELIAKIPGYDNLIKQKTLYIHSFTMRPELRNFGFGKKITHKFIQVAKDMGYERLIEHSREGASRHILELFGAVTIKKFNNWYDTGESYYFHNLKL